MSARWISWTLWLVIGMAAALLTNYLLYNLLINKEFLYSHIEVPSDTGEPAVLGVNDVLVASAIPMLIGAVIFLLLQRFTNNPKWIYWTILLLILVLSFINPFMIPAISVKSAIGLNILHLAPALFSGITMTRFVK